MCFWVLQKNAEKKAPDKGEKKTGEEKERRKESFIHRGKPQGFTWNSAKKKKKLKIHEEKKSEQQKAFTYECTEYNRKGREYLVHCDHGLRDTLLRCRKYAVHNGNLVGVLLVMR